MYRLTCLFFCLTTLPALAQYQPMAVEGNKWIVFDNIAGIANHHVLFTEGDSTVDGQTFRKVYRSEITNITTGSPWEAEPPYEISDLRRLHGLLRDDTVAQRVYARPTFLPFDFCPTDTTLLLYDFSVDAGDTLTGCFYDCYPQIVDSVRVKAFYGQLRRAVYNGPFPFIEGIGAPPSPFLDIDNNCIALVAKGQAALLDFCQGSFAECGLVVTATHMLSTDQSVSIFPNPARTQIQVMLRRTTSETPIITLSDLHGRVLQRQAIPRGSTGLPLTVANYPAGVYLLSVQSGTRRVVERVVIE